INYQLAQQTPVMASGYDEYARVGIDAGGFGTRAGTPTATFIVNYTGFTPEAQAAFQMAVDIWATKLVSSVPIRINAKWANQGASTLGSAGPSYVVRDFPGAPLANTWYVPAIANALSGSDTNTSSADMDLTFNNARTDWYMGLDGNVPSGKYDLVT